MASLFENLSQQYRTPRAVQQLLRELNYNRKHTLYSAKTTWKKKSAHCFEAAFLAAAILEHRGYPPLVVSISSVDHLDHVLFVFKQKGKWGSVARSRDDGLHGRPAIFRSIRDLVWSYFEPFVDMSGRIKGYALAHLDDTQTDWRNSPRNVWKAEHYLCDIAHTKIVSSEKRYERLLNHYKTHKSHPRKPYWW